MKKVQLKNGERDEEEASPAQANRSWVGLRSSLRHYAMARCHASASDLAARCEMSERVQTRGIDELQISFREVESEKEKINRVVSLEIFCILKYY